MKIKHVYDWKGSLATYPEYFHLVDFQDRTAQEHDKIDTIKLVLNMIETSAELYGSGKVQEGSGRISIVKIRKIKQMQLQ